MKVSNMPLFTPSGELLDMAAGTPPREVAQSLGVSVPTLYRWVPAGSLD